MCKTCIYKPESSLDLQRLEEEVKNRYGFTGHRICHYTKDVCCKGFWDKHKDEFQVGQVSQRMGWVEFIELDLKI